MIQSTMPIDLNELEKKVDHVDNKVSSILSLLQGNKLDKSDQGVIGIVNDLNVRVTSLEKWRDRIIWMVIGMAAPASIGFVEILKKIFIK